MATVGSSLSSALTVFKGVGNGNLTDLYRGGTYVQNINAYSGVDTSGAGLALSQLVGLVYPAISNSWTDSNPPGSGGGVTSTITYNTNGTAVTTTISSGTWRLTGTSSNYEIMFNKTLGTTPTGDSVNTWLALSSTRSWTLSVGALQYKECSGFIAIRDTLANVELSNVAMSMSADGTA
jgi:hypothetical protein